VPDEQNSSIWQSSAKCCGKDPSIFFHPEGERGAARKRRRRLAKAICMTCPVIDMCRQFFTGPG
jgi:WhiB family redox-sensing transcriptional regulator